MYQPIDIVNLQNDIKALKSMHDQLISLNNEICATLVRVECFLEHYHDYVVDDLPL